MSKFRVSSPAELDLAQIWAFIAEDSVDAAERMRRNLEATFKLLAKNPRLGRERPDLQSGLRSFPIKDFLSFYHVVDTGILIVRVVSGYRDLSALFEQ